MFVSVILDPGGIDSAQALVNVLSSYGFKKIQRSCWESVSIKETDLAQIKKEIDRVTDYYDTVRIYQFPIDGMFVITELKQKKWKKCQMKGGTTSATAKTASSAQKANVQRSTVQKSRGGIHNIQSQKKN